MDWTEDEVVDEAERLSAKHGGDFAALAECVRARRIVEEVREEMLRMQASDRYGEIALELQWRDRLDEAIKLLGGKP